MTYGTRLLILIILNIICTGLIILFIILYFYKISFPKAFLNELNTNFGDFSIMDFNLTNNCSPSINLGFWGGIEKGCDCRGKDSGIEKPEHKNKIFKGKCSNEEIKAQCKNIEKIDKIDIDNYKGFKFCPIIGKSYNYYLENAVKLNQNCSNDKKECGILDSLNQKLCLNLNEDCPINDIKIDNNNNIDNSDIKYKTVKLNNGQFLHYTNQSTDKPILIKLKLSDDKPCIYPGQYSWKYYYELEPINGTCNISVINSTIDNRYVKFDTTSKKNLYKDNNIYDKIEKIVDYPLNLLENSNIDFFSRTYLGFDKECMKYKGFSFDYFNSLNSDLKFIKNLHIVILVIFGLYIFGILTCWVTYLDNKVLNVILFLGYITSKIFKSCKKHLIYLKLGLMITQLLILIPSIFNIKKLSKLNCDCGDDYTNNLISTLKNQFNVIHIYVIVILVIDSIGILGNLILIIEEIVSGDYKTENNDLLNPSSSGEDLIPPSKDSHDNYESGGGYSGGGSF